MDLRELKAILKEYLQEFPKLIYKSTKGLQILFQRKQKPLYKPLHPQFKPQVQKPSKQVSRNIRKGLSLSITMVIGGFLILLKKYLGPAINHISAYIAEGFFTVLYFFGKKSSKGLDSLADRVARRIKRKKSTFNVKYLEDMVKINMIIAPTYLVILVLFFVIWSLTNKLSQMSIETIYLIIPLLLILCIPFFSFYNLLKYDGFSITDLALNIIFIVVVLTSLTMFILALF